MTATADRAVAVTRTTVASVGGPDDDPFDARRAWHAPGLLGPFNAAGVLAAADIHVALRLARLTRLPVAARVGPDAGVAGFGDGPGAGTSTDTDTDTATAAATDTDTDTDDLVLLAVALAVRAPRLGHVCVDLATIRGSVTIDTDTPVDLQALPWPEPRRWIECVAASPLVAAGVDDPVDRPLRVVGSLLYLDRYWREERQVALDLAARSHAPATGVDLDCLADGLTRLFPGEGPDDQRLAAATAVLRRFSVIAGGPGTGKTTTVARILALLDEQAAVAGAPPPLVALAAPTGKAATRLEEAVHAEAAAIDVSPATRARLDAVSASTLHRLLGWRPDSHNRFRHNRYNRLPHDVVIVDETSMVSLSLMARLVEAVRAGGRLVLVGDPEQLASVEAGAVLGDIVGPAADGLLLGKEAGKALARVCGHPVASSPPPPGSTVGDGIVVLQRRHRFGGAIATLAEAVRRGDADAAMALLRTSLADVRWIPVDLASAGAGASLALVRDAVVAAGCRVNEAAREGDAREAVDALGAFRVLCAHRRGPYGVDTWMPRIETWLAAKIDGFAAEGRFYVGRPLLVTENDYGLRLFNGDTGVVIATRGGHVAAVFPRRSGLLELSPSRLAAVDTVYAMTVHKSQGSQFDGVAVLLPDPGSPILTRELLYTAITRARRHVIVAGTEAALRAAIARPIARASGLRRSLWPDRIPGPDDERSAGGDSE
jgi:exodeoxyribonuclease V alpha subunit